MAKGLDKKKETKKQPAKAADKAPVRAVAKKRAAR